MGKTLRVNRGIEVKGHNGYFKLHRVETLTFDGSKDFCKFWLFSARSGWNPPCAMEGPKRTVLATLEWMTEQLKASMPDESPDHWQDDPEYPSADWRSEAFADNTRLGYLDWVEAQKEAELWDQCCEGEEARS